jgi:hypothetical protein
MPKPLPAVAEGPPDRRKNAGVVPCLFGCGQSRALAPGPERDETREVQAARNGARMQFPQVYGGRQAHEIRPWTADDPRQRGCGSRPTHRMVQGVRPQVEPDPAEMARQYGAGISGSCARAAGAERLIWSSQGPSVIRFPSGTADQSVTPPRRLGGAEQLGYPTANEPA